MKDIKQILSNLQSEKIATIKQIKITPIYSNNLLNDFFIKVDEIRNKELKTIWENTGYDDNYPITESHIISLMKQAFLLGKEEQQEIHYHGLDN